MTQTLPEQVLELAATAKRGDVLIIRFSGGMWGLDTKALDAAAKRLEDAGVTIVIVPPTLGVGHISLPEDDYVLRLKTENERLRRIVSAVGTAMEDR